MTTQPTPRPAAPARRAGATTIALGIEGDFDYETCDDLLVAFAAALDRDPRATTVSVDCSRMTVCDSMGLSTLLQMRRRADGAGLRLLIHSRPAFLDRLLELTGTTEHLLRESAVEGGRDG